jgi:hypothetical protein
MLTQRSRKEQKEADNCIDLPGCSNYLVFMLFCFPWKCSYVVGCLCYQTLHIAIILTGKKRWTPVDAFMPLCLLPLCLLPLCLLPLCWIDFLSITSFCHCLWYCYARYLTCICWDMIVWFLPWTLEPTSQVILHKYHLLLYWLVILR